MYFAPDFKEDIFNETKPVTHMIPSLREAYNNQFSETKYATFLTDLYSLYNHKPNFRISETLCTISYNAGLTGKGLKRPSI